MVLPHPAGVHHLAFSPDGTLLATACDDQVVRVWNAATWKEAFPPLEHASPVNAVSFSPSNEYLFTGSQSLARWSARSGKPDGDPIQPEGAGRVVAISPDGTQFVTQDDDAKRLREIASGVSRGNFPLAGTHRDLGLYEPPNYNVFSPQGTYFAIPDEGSHVAVYEVKQSRVDQIEPPRTASNFANVLAFDPNEERILYSSLAVGYLYFLKHGQHLPVSQHPYTDERLNEANVGQTQGMGVSSTATSFSHDGRFVAIAAENGITQILDSDLRIAVGASVTQNATVEATVFSPASHRLVTAGGDGSVKIWKVNPDPSTQIVSQDFYFKPSLICSSKGIYAVERQASEGWIRLWDPRTGEELSRIGDGFQLANLSLDASQTRLACRSREGTQVWNIESGRLTNAHTHRCLSFNLRPDGNSLFVSLDEGGQVLDLEQDESVPVQLPSRGLYPSALFLGQGTLFTGGVVGDLTKWHLDELASPQSIMLGGRITAISTPSNGATLLVSSANGSLVQVEPRSLSITEVPIPRQGSIVSSAISHAGDLAVTSNSRGQVRLWDLQTSAPVGPLLMRNSSSLAQAAFGPDSRYVAAIRHSAPVSNVKIVVRPLEKPLLGTPEQVFHWTQVVTGINDR